MLAQLFVMAIAVQAEAPKDFVGVLRSMHAEQRKLRLYQDEWTLDAEGRGPKLFAKRWIDGKRYRMVMYSDDAPLMEAAYDGTTHSMIMHMAKAYSVAKVPNPDFDTPFSAEPDHTHEDEQDFNLGFNGGYDLVIRMKPWPTIRSIKAVTVNGVPSKVVDSEWARPDGRKVDVQMVFDPDKWLLRRFMISGKNRDGVDSKMVLQAKVIRPKSMADGLFKVSPESYKGYTKMGD
ncbi:MAG: hypothetical protein ACAH95_02680 [Fimbriimonas sp.]